MRRLQAWLESLSVIEQASVSRRANRHVAGQARTISTSRNAVRRPASRTTHGNAAPQELSIGGPAAWNP
jgi:hypothetical protein